MVSGWAGRAPANHKRTTHFNAGKAPFCPVKTQENPGLEQSRFPRDLLTFPDWKGPRMFEQMVRVESPDESINRHIFYQRRCAWPASATTARGRYSDLGHPPRKPVPGPRSPSSTELERRPRGTPAAARPPLELVM